MPRPAPLPLEVRLWDKINGPWTAGVSVDDCWLFTGSWRGLWGHGKIREGERGSRCLYAHRVAYTLFWGWVSPAEVVRHRCDTPLCCNPFHLEAGTPLDNYLDQVERGRDNWRRTA